MNGGFLGIGKVIPKNLIYVKLASSPPYFRQKSIECSQDMIQQHKLYLVELLKFFTRRESKIAFSPFDKEISRDPEYNHLCRRI